MTFARGAEIYGESEPADYLYQVVSGAVRTYNVLDNGRRQISSFYQPDDIFGLEVGGEHTFFLRSSHPLQSTSDKAQRGSRASRARQGGRPSAWRMTATELQRAQDHIKLLIKTAQERVAGFLLEMAARSPDAGEVDLPMSRQDIADYLGLTIETVSRMMTQLEKSGVIALATSRRIVLRKRGTLKRMDA